MSSNERRRGVGRLKTAFVLAAAAFLLAQGAWAQSATAVPPATSSAAPASAALQAAAAPANAVPTALPPWEVSTVKPSSPDARGSMFVWGAAGISTTNVPLFNIVREAFGLENDRLTGGPAWAKTTNFDVEAKVSAEDAPRFKALALAQKRQMAVALLEERFGLKFHHETRDLPMYQLVVARSGIKMQVSKPDDPGAEGHGRHMLMMHGRGQIESTATGMTGLVRLLSGQLGRTVVDKTGLAGNYDYTLDWTPDDAPLAMVKSGNPAAGDSAAAQETSGPSLFTALEEQLGLKLEATKGPVDVIVIDQLLQPTAN